MLISGSFWTVSCKLLYLLYAFCCFLCSLHSKVKQCFQWETLSNLKRQLLMNYCNNLTTISISVFTRTCWSSWVLGYMCVFVCVSFFWVFNYKKLQQRLSVSSSWCTSRTWLMNQENQVTPSSNSSLFCTSMGSTSARILTHLTNAQGSQPSMSTLRNVNSDSIPVQTLASQPVLWLNVPPQQWILCQRPLPLIMRKIVKCFTNYFSLSLLNKMSFAASFIAIRYDWCDANFV